MPGVPYQNLRRILASSVTMVALLGTLPAAAQTSNASTPASGTRSDLNPLTPPAPVTEEVQVTGSRVKRTALEATSPTVTVNAASIQARGLTNTADVLNQLPQIGAPTVGDNQSNFSNDTAGISAINLRNLGVSRTLVLIDGKRTVGSIPPGQDAGNGVDVSTIPSYLIDHIDVVTGGASSTYGSEATGGAVNIVLRKTYNGILFNQQYGASGYGDGNTSTTDLLAGTSFANGDGHIIFAGEYQKEDAIYSRSRELSARDTNDGGIYVPSSYNLNGLFSTNAGNYVTLPNGSSVPYDSATYGYNRDAVRTIVIPTDRISFYTKFDYDIAPNITVFANARFSRTKATTVLEPIAIGPTTTIGFTGDALALPINNPYAPASLTALGLTDDGNGNIADWRKRFAELGDRGSDVTRYNYSLNGGFSGTIADRFNWEAYYTYGETTSSSIETNSGNVINLQNALDAENVGGVIQCANAAARAEGCVPINLFGAGNASQAALNYVRATKSYNDDLSETDINADINGPIFTLPGGPVRLALGVEYRREHGSSIPDALSQEGFSLDTQGPATEGGYDDKDFYAEGIIPILSNLPFVKSLSVDLGYRFSNYSLPGVGDQQSYKYGVSYAPVKDIRFRVENSVAIRAPNIDELYTGRSQNAISVTDPCSDQGLASATNPALRAANCARIPGITPGFTEQNFNQQTEISYQSGNPNLDAERAKILTYGVVLEPRWIPRFSATVDAFQYHIDHAIQAIDIQTVADECADTGLAVFCDEVHRNGTTGLISGVDSQVINVGEIREAGIDTTINYEVPLTSLSSKVFRNSAHSGALDITWNYEYLNYLNYISVPGVVTNQTGLFGAPKNKWNLDLLYRDDRFQFNYQLRYIGQQRYQQQGDGPNIGAFVYHDISMRYQIVKQLSAYFGINNLLDKKPPLVEQQYQQSGAGVASGVTGTETVPQVYDAIGRFFYAGVKVTL